MLYRTAPVPPLIQELAIKIEKVVIRKVIILGPFLILGIQVRKGPMFECSLCSLRILLNI